MLFPVLEERVFYGIKTTQQFGWSTFLTGLTKLTRKVFKKKHTCGLLGYTF